jgi:5'-phosphate synthase pdxT subunit
MFIRAPLIGKRGPGVEVLAERAGSPIWVRQGRLWATTFHPELGPDRRLQKRFLDSLI